MSRRRPLKSPKEIVVQEALQEVRQEIRSLQISGPLPPPAWMEQYEKLMPGATKYFFDSMSAQSTHRQELERTVVQGNERRANRGQWMAYSIFIGVFVTGVMLTVIGIDVAGIIISIGSLAGVLALFFGRRKASDRELESKR